MNVKKLIRALFLIGTPKCSRCGRQVNTRMMDDDDMRDIMARDDIVCVDCTCAEAGSDPWRITLVSCDD